MLRTDARICKLRLFFPARYLEMLGLQGVAIAHQHSPLQQVAQLTDVAGQLPRLQVRQSLAGQRQATLWHEMAHVFTLQLSKYRVPRWLTEGLSQYEEHRRSAPWGRELTMQYAALMARTIADVVATENAVVVGRAGHVVTGASEAVLRVLDGKTPKKVVVVPGRIVNIVV